MNPIIEINNLSKTYKNNGIAKKVLNDINLEIEPGQIIGYIGPNGAGKSTTVKIICGLLLQFKGNIKVAGFDIRRDAIEIKKKIGYIPESASIYESITPMEYFNFIIEMRQLDRKNTLERARKLLHLFEIEESANQRVGSLSKGMKQKVLITSALLHNPDILFMDEPLSGLDANSVIKVKEIITHMAKEGKTVFYSSHLMDVVERVSDRIILINQGQIIADGTFESLQSQENKESLEQMFARLTGSSSDHFAEINETFNN